MAKNLGIPIPPEGAGRMYDVVYARPDAPVDATILSQTFQGYLVHWRTEQRGNVKVRRTRLHPDYDTCPWCKDSPPPVWSGYIGVWDEHCHEEKIVVMTADTARQLSHLHCQYVGLRGRRVVWARRDNGLYRPVLVGLSAYPATLPLRPAFPMGHTLATMFGVPLRYVACEPCQPTPDGPTLTLGDGIDPALLGRRADA